jgi:hypothetical protein
MATVWNLRPRSIRSRSIGFVIHAAFSWHESLPLPADAPKSDNASQENVNSRPMGQGATVRRGSVSLDGPVMNDDPKVKANLQDAWQNVFLPPSESVWMLSGVVDITERLQLVEL